MGNKMCASRRRAVADRFTRPQRLLRQPSDVDYKKLRRLILDRKLAPCFDPVDDPPLAGGDVEECPICFLYYPSLNRSRCCAKGICTECFLQMKPSHTSRPAQCPFCKMSCYAVEYHGARTEEEKGLEQAEEQKVIEARIRMQTESQVEEGFMPINQPQTLLELLRSYPDVEGSSGGHEEREIAPLESSCLQQSVDVLASSYVDLSNTRHEFIHVDLEEIMLMEATWLSLQDRRLQRSESSQIDWQIHREDQLGASPSEVRGKSSTSALTNDFSATIARLAEPNILQIEVPRLDCEPNRTGRDPNGYLLHESNIMKTETACSSSFAPPNIEQQCVLATI